MPSLIYMTQNVSLDSSSAVHDYGGTIFAPLGYHALTSSAVIEESSGTGGFVARDYVSFYPMHGIELYEGPGPDGGSVTPVYSSFAGMRITLLDAIPEDCSMVIRITVPCISGEAWHNDGGEMEQD